MKKDDLEMALPKYQQKTGKKLFIESLRSLRIKTLEHLYRERVVPTRIRHHFAEEMMQLLDEIDYLVHYANSIYPDEGNDRINIADLYQRQLMQKQAIEKLALFARNVQSLVWAKYANKKSVNAWTSSIAQAQAMIKAWADSDKVRWGTVKLDRNGGYYLKKD